jgi:hypothetical protein
MICAKWNDRKSDCKFCGFILKAGFLGAACGSSAAEKSRAFATSADSYIVTDVLALLFRPFSKTAKTTGQVVVSLQDTVCQKTWRNKAKT